jgi:transposase
MQDFVQGADRQQTTLLPECLDDWVDESNSIRAVDVFVDALELRDLGFAGVDPAATGRPAYHPSLMLKLYIYGYLNRVQSSRRLEREAGRNLEVMWLTGRLAPDHKTIADFRKDNGPAIKKVCAQFVEVVGMIDERTKDLPAERANERRKGFEAFFSNGTVSGARETNGFDLFDFAPTEYPDFKLPGQLPGNERRTLWKFYLKLNGETPEIASARLWGVPFHQTKNENCSHMLICHGMGGV